METYIDRIKQIKSQKKITNDRLSEMTEIPLGTLSKILAGISDSPKLSNIVSICDALGCSVGYVLTGVPDNTNNYTLEENEIDVIEDLRRLDEHGRELVAMVIAKEAERCARKPSEHRFDARIVAGRAVVGSPAVRATAKPIGLVRRSIDLYDMPVSAGTGMFLADAQMTTINIPLNDETEGASFALRIKGNSMEPKYRDGDVLLVEECESVEYGDLGIFVLDGEGYFKQYGGDRLISLNPAYSDILLKEYTNTACIGKVTGKLKRK